MNKRYTFKKNVLVTAIAASSIIGGQSLTVQAQGQSQLEEIIVTASARKQTVQDIPYNISAMSGTEMEALQIVDQADLLRSMSGVSVVDRGYRNSGTVNSIIIRGLNVDNGLNGDIALNATPTVSTYVDNTPLFANFILKDIERVEVLRGPQGTLYGAGSLGGTVRYITRKPDTQQIEGRIDANYSQTEGSSGDNMSLDGMINLPLGDRFAVRASIGHIENDGIIDYANTYQLNQFGEPMVDVGNGNCVSPREATDDQVLHNGACYKKEKDADDVEIDYGRIALLWDATENLNITAAYQTQEDKVGARRATTLGNNNQPVGSALRVDYDDYESGQVLLEPSSRDVELFVVDVEWDLGFATLTSNSSLYDNEGYGESDNGGLWVSGGEVDPTTAVTGSPPSVMPDGPVPPSAPSAATKMTPLCRNCAWYPTSPLQALTGWSALSIWIRSSGFTRIATTLE